ncbi:MAG: site-specific integrase [Candidatus Hatepunaea meridiana]|nr:site-specific integrase [Candidatus Hatepunaea meridiana]
MLNTAIHQAKSLGWKGDLPEKTFKQLKLPDTEPPKWITEDQIQILLTNADSEFKAYLQFLLHTGCRRNEALGVTWEDIDLVKRQILIRGEVGKMGKRRSIPINDVLYKVLYKFRGVRTGLLFPNYQSNQISMKFRRLARKIDLPREYSLHSLRSTFGSALINKGIDIYTVSKLLGHSSVKVTEKHYLALDPEHVKSAINQLDYGK